MHSNLHLRPRLSATAGSDRSLDHAAAKPSGAKRNNVREETNARLSNDFICLPRLYRAFLRHDLRHQSVRQLRLRSDPLAEGLAVSADSAQLLDESVSLRLENAELLQSSLGHHSMSQARAPSILTEDVKLESRSKTEGTLSFQ